MTDEQKKKILSFLSSELLGVVSTITPENNLESAVVAFSETPNLEIIFGTFNNTRKYGNLKNNPRISFVVYSKDATVQYEGTAEETFGTELENCRTILLTKNPGSKKYAFDPLQTFFKITPKWCRYTSFQSDTEEIFEINF